MSDLILVLDQGTTSSRAIIFDVRRGKILALSQHEITQYYPKPGWVEHDAIEIWEKELQAAREALDIAGVSASEIRCIGIANQRETVVVWNAETGEPLCPAIVWQCRRTASLCEELRKDTELVNIVREKTGLLIDPYFSATKINWLQDHISGLRDQLVSGEALIGTIESWLIWKLTGGRSHVTDTTNACRTLLFNIHEMAWDDVLLERFRIPRRALPAVCHPADDMGITDESLLGARIPITGAIGDQQAALIGQKCVEPGLAKNTYGTGCFLLVNTGETPCLSKHGLLTTVAWSGPGRVQYALEGSVFVGGAVVQWLRDELGIVADAARTEELALSVPDTGGVVFVPAFVGLGSPYWDPNVRGALFGLTRGTDKPHLVRAALEAIAFQCCVLIQAVQEDAGFSLKSLRVDGGAAANVFLMQFQADILGVSVERPANLEVTAWGAACAAALGSGYWESLDDIDACATGAVFKPEMSESDRSRRIEEWHKAVSCARQWTSIV